jgi:hypothetical protein
VKDQSQALLPRGLGALLDETFAVYGRHLNRWLIIAALVQTPVALVAFGLGQLSGGPVVALAAYVLGVAGTVLIYGAVAYGVGQHYVTGAVGVRECYARAWWRVRSLTLLALAPMAALLAVALPLRYGGDVAGGALALLLVPLVLAAAVYWSMAVPTVVVEEQKALGGLRRSYALMKGSWLRAVGVALTLMLVALGMAIVLTIPLSLLASVSDIAPAFGAASILAGIGGMIVGIAVPPVLMIAWTLLYNDLRVRKENYDVAAMSRELGIATT